MSWAASMKAMEAAERRQQREAQRRSRDLERRAKEQAKLSELEHAHLEVEMYENRLEVLLSVHKEQGPTWDWAAVKASLPPPTPRRTSQQELRARQRIPLLSPEERAGSDVSIERARTKDDQTFQESMEAYAREKADWEKMKSLAHRILAGEHKAFTEALVELSPLAEISTLGSTLHFTVHDEATLECVLKVDGIQAIPGEVKSLTASGKLSAKPMPKTRFHELYQDYICSCIFRVAREVFALLPMKTILVTATADFTSPGSGQPSEHPVLSAVMTRTTISTLDFDYLEPSEAMDSFLHRGDFRASRKTGAFAPVTPIAPADLPKPPPGASTLRELLADVRRLRDEMRAEFGGLDTHPVTPPI